MKQVQRSILRITMVVLLGGILGCNSIGNAINPYYEPPTAEALKGQPNDHALNSAEGKADTARAALTAMGEYRRAQLPQPVNPVVQPAVVRLMWVPDHLNSNGDLVPAHYYYLRVLDDRWAVTDAFELEQQLQGNQQKPSIPFTYSRQ